MYIHTSKHSNLLSPVLVHNLPNSETLVIQDLRLDRPADLTKFVTSATTLRRLSISITADCHLRQLCCDILEELPLSHSHGSVDWPDLATCGLVIDQNCSVAYPSPFQPGAYQTS